MAEELMLFSEEEMIPWQKEWKNMPDYLLEDLAPKFQMLVSFACAQDVIDFGEMIGQKLNPREGRQLKSIWWPQQEIGRMVNKRFIEVKK